MLVSGSGCSTLEAYVHGTMPAKVSAEEASAKAYGAPESDGRTRTLSHHPSHEHRLTRHRTSEVSRLPCAAVMSTTAGRRGQCAWGMLLQLWGLPTRRVLAAAVVRLCAGVSCIGYAERQRQGMVWVAMASVSHALALYMVRIHAVHDHYVLG